jgi:mono/diheme cytochrome c family protein
MVRSLRSSAALAALTVSFVIAGCHKPQSNDNQAEPSPETPSQPSAPSDNAGGGGDEATAQAETIFKSRCSTCHGMEGKGNGPAAITLNPKPRNYTDVAWQKSVTDDHIRETIIKGGAAVGKSPMMAPNPDLENKPAVVDALVKKIRAFAGK